MKAWQQFFGMWEQGWVCVEVGGGATLPAPKGRDFRPQVCTTLHSSSLAQELLLLCERLQKNYLLKATKDASASVN